MLHTHENTLELEKALVIHKRILSWDATYFSGKRTLNLDRKNIGLQEIKDILIPFLNLHPELYKLNLNNNRLCDESIQELLKYQNLTVLKLRQNNIKTKGAELLANRNILRLDLSVNEIEKAGVEFLAANNTFTNLSIIDIPISNEAINLFSKNTSLEHIRLSFLNDEQACILAKNNRINILHIYKSELGTTGAKALARNKTLKEVKIKQSRNQPTYPRINAISFSKNLNLTKINLYNCQMTDKNMVEFAKHSTLTVLNVGCNNFGEIGLNALANNVGITSLNLKNNNLKDKGAKIIGRKKDLVRLNVSSNSIFAKGAKSIKCPSLTKLTLNHNEIKDEGAIELAKHENLTELSLISCKIGDEGVIALAANPNLKNLNLMINEFCLGATSLAKNTNLTTLNIVSNSHITTAIKAFADNKSITRLNVSATNMRTEGALALVSNKNLQVIIANHNPISIEGELALQTIDPIKRVNFCKKARIKTDFPSLLSICIYAAKQLPYLNKLQLNEVLPSDLTPQLTLPKP